MVAPSTCVVVSVLACRQCGYDHHIGKGLGVLCGMFCTDDSLFMGGETVEELRYQFRNWKNALRAMPWKLSLVKQYCLCTHTHTGIIR